MFKTFGRALALISLLLAPMSLWADDIDIFSGGSVNVPPNVLIIFDTSSTMSQMVASSIYDPTHNYGADPGNAGYSRYTVYEKKIAGPNISWTSFTTATSNIGCNPARSALDSIGIWAGYIDGRTPFGCSTSPRDSRVLATGNYLNYYSVPGNAPATRLSIAQQTIKELLTVYNGAAVRFGLMRFNPLSAHDRLGGRLISPIGSSTESMNAAIDALAIDDDVNLDATPLAETLTEAGIYFAGLPSWSNPGTTYTSPIQWRCQNNYVILMTDGQSSFDDGNGNGSNLFNTARVFPQIIGSYGYVPSLDDANIPNHGSHWLDNAAKYLFDTDLITSGSDLGGVSFNDPAFPRQHIMTYTISFGAGTDITLLQRAVDTDHGNGLFFEAGNAAELKTVFTSIVGDILSRNSNFVAPVVPVSRLNKVYSGSSLYLGLFLPTASGIWEGNLKKYGLSTSGEVLDVNGNPALDANGTIGAEVSSLWGSSADGPNVTRGGAGAIMHSQADRNYFYTHKAGSSPDLTDAVNAFAKANTAISAADMSVSSDTIKDDLIDYLRADGIYAPAGTSERTWVMGDVIHSTPAVISIANDKTLVFVGSNDGFLHCLIDSDGGNNEVTTTNPTPIYTDDSVKEAWSFVPWDLVATLYKTKDELKTNSRHEYFVDGSPLLFRYDSDLYLSFGLRGGGTNYYTLKVGQYSGSDASASFVADSYKSPAFVWQLGPTVTNMAEPLGQSWYRPTVMKLRTGSTSSTTAMFLTGGYDADEDNDKPNSNSAPTNAPASGDDRGRAVYAVYAANGLLVGGDSPVFRFSRADGQTAMTHAIVDQTIFDYDDDGFVDTAYAGDLGGNLFVMNDRDANGSWNFRHLFSARGSDDARWLKFFYGPDVTLERDGDFVFIGSGDRNNPTDCYTKNRFYAIRNKWLAPGSPSLPMHESDLGDVTSYGYSSYASNYMDNGWFIKLESGEKVVSRPITFGGIVVFTTYLSNCSTSGGTVDECRTSDLGEGRIYALDYRTGKAAFNFDSTNDTTTSDGQKVIVLEHTDRYKKLSGLPTAPVLIMTKDGPQILTGTTEGIIKLNLPTNLSVNRYYWKQI